MPELGKSVNYRAIYSFCFVTSPAMCTHVHSRDSRIQLTALFWFVLLSAWTSGFWAFCRSSTACLDHDWAENIVYMKATMTGASRILKMYATTMQLLAWHKERGLPGALVFPNRRGEHWHPNTITVGMARLLSRAAIEGATMHSSRHTHAFHLLSVGVPLPVVSHRLGHASPAITLSTYAHMLPADQDRAANAHSLQRPPHPCGSQLPYIKTKIT